MPNPGEPEVTVEPGPSNDSGPSTQSGPSIEPVAFVKRMPNTNRLRIGIVAAAAVALVVGAVANSLAASPPPATSGAAPGNGGLFAAPFAALDPSDDGFDEGPLDMGHMGGGFGDITITAINGSDVSLKTADGWTRTITVSGTVALTRGGQKISLGDLKTGDHIRFRQTRNSDGTFTVTAIAVVVPRVVGTVGDVTSSGFTVKTRDGSTWTITVDSSTAYKVGAADGTKSDVVAGANVLVQGDSPAANQIKALSVEVAPAQTVGTVTAKTADSITIKTRAGTTATIHVGSGTTYRVAGVASASLNDIKVDMVVIGVGRARSDGSIDATTVAGGVGRGLGRGLGKQFLKGGPFGPFKDWAEPDNEAAPAGSPSTSS